MTDPSAIDSSVTPTADSSTDYSSFLPIDFDLTTGDGWSYHVSIASLPTVRAESDITVAPPGKAVVRYSLDGDAEAEITSLDTGRTAPELDFMVNYAFTDFDADVPNTLSYGLDASGEETERPTWTCSSQGSDTPECLMVAFLHSETPSEANVGEPVTPEIAESQTQRIVAAFAPPRLATVTLDGRGCIVTIDMETKKASGRAPEGVPVKGCKVT